MADTVKVAALQLRLTDDLNTNVSQVVSSVHEAADNGAQIVLPPELFEGHYFCRNQAQECFQRAHSVAGHPFIDTFSKLAREKEVVLPISFFEKDGQSYYNSAAVLDADGSLLGVYRKSHIPDGPGYQEKFYFRPGNTGFKTWETRYAKIGVGICWDQWFPEAARAMMLQGAQLLLYPTAIGSEPHQPTLDTKARWQRAMIGHAVSNVVPVVAANRVGVEGEQNFYGSSFIADPSGEKLSELSRDTSGIAYAEFDLEAIAAERAAWGFFRDRRPELYTELTRS